MKHLIILFLLFTTSVYSQDNEPTPWGFKWGFSTTQRPFILDSFPQTSIMTGFQWSGTAKMNNALGNNSTTGKYYHAPSTAVLKPINWIFQPTWIDGSDYVPGYYGAVMMQYDPSLPLTTSNFGNILRPDDPADPIFGFKNRKGTISNTPSDPNYSRLVINNKFCLFVS